MPKTHWVKGNDGREYLEVDGRKVLVIRIIKRDQNHEVIVRTRQGKVLGRARFKKESNAKSFAKVIKSEVEERVKRGS